MKQIVIVGAGFGGIKAALKLEKKFKNDRNVHITLIDKHDYHLFTPNLYEAATTQEELVSIEQIKKSITLPIADLLKGKNIRFVKGEVENLDVQKKELAVEHHKIHFDYLVLASGSESEFFNIPGAKENSLTLKDLPDALRIRQRISFIIQSQRYELNKKNLRFVIAGGGYTGVELAGELKGLVDFLAWENQYPREKINIEIIEGNPQVIFGFDPRMSRDAYWRLHDLGIDVRLSERITSVDSHYIELASGEKLSYDALFWTAGVKARKVPGAESLQADPRGKLKANQFLQAEGHDNIFVLGDVAYILGREGKPVPGSAQDAEHQAGYLADVLPFVLKNQKPQKPYKNIKHGFIVNVGGKWAVMSYRGVYMKGFFAYAIDRLAHLRYYLFLVGPWKALKCIILQTEIYGRND